MSKSVKQAVKDTLHAVYEDVGNEFAFALDDIRQKVVEEPWFGRAVTPEAADFYRWLGPTPGSSPELGDDTGKGDALGRTSAEPVADIMPMEGRPSNVEERMATAEAYARHQDAGPFGLMEMENVHSHEWREFDEWLDGRETEVPCVESGVEIEAEGEMVIDDVPEEMEIDD